MNPLLVSGFTIVRNAEKYQYPVIESIRSILPICDEFVVNVGDSEDDTLDIIRSINDPKIRIIENKWDMSMGKLVLSYQTNLALQACQGTWGFYLQTDEVIHEKDLKRLRRLMESYADDESIDAMRLNWLHFYGSYFRYRIDSGWYQKQDRIVRNNGQVVSWGDAYSFKRTDDKDINRVNTKSLLYHYGWVQSGEVMTRRRVNAEQIGFTHIAEESERKKDYQYGDLGRFHPYFGSHPAVMNERVSLHHLSQADKMRLKRDYWWHPMCWLGARYKTGKRIKERIE